MNAHSRADLNALIEGLPSKSAKIRKLDQAGLSRADIARFLGLRYQHVRNVLVAGEARAKAAGQAPAPAVVKIDEAGRLVLPAAFRDWIGLEPGDQLMVQAQDGAVRVTTQRAALAKARALLGQYVKDDQSLAEDLIADRRTEAAGD